LFSLSGNTTGILVEDSRAAMARIAANYYDNPSASLNVIGITGTNGKTSTSYFAQQLLHGLDGKVGVIGTLGMFVGEDKLPIAISTRTTPEAIELQRTFRAMINGGASRCVMEVSSHSLALERVEATRFKHAVFTNLTQDHLDFHHTMEAYYQEKKKLFHMTEGMKIINCDDPYGLTLAQELGDHVCSFGLHGDWDVRAENIDLSIQGSSFDLIVYGKKARVVSKLLGEFSVYNLLAAAAIASHEGMDFQAICAMIPKVHGICGRFEIVETPTDYAVVIDYAHTPDGVEKVIAAANALTKGRVITVFGCGGDRDHTKRPIMGRIAAEGSDYIVVTSDNMRTEDPMKIIADIQVGIPKDYKNVVCQADRRKAIALALDMADKDDLVLLLGKGHERYQIVGARKVPMDERTIVKEYFEKEQ
jgi:UDP-N-acetylmuramoyl-L-alanyl-D-glutamate--2,6-diaminopimelate ligase